MRSATTTTAVEASTAAAVGSSTTVEATTAAHGAGSSAHVSMEPAATATNGRSAGEAAVLAAGVALAGSSVAAG